MPKTSATMATGNANGGISGMVVLILGDIDIELALHHRIVSAGANTET